MNSIADKNSERSVEEYNGLPNPFSINLSFVILTNKTSPKAFAALRCFMCPKCRKSKSP